MPRTTKTPELDKARQERDHYKELVDRLNKKLSETHNEKADTQARLDGTLEENKLLKKNNSEYKKVNERLMQMVEMLRDDLAVGASGADSTTATAGDDDAPLKRAKKKDKKKEKRKSKEDYRPDVEYEVPYVRYSQPLVYRPASYSRVRYEDGNYRLHPVR